MPEQLNPYAPPVATALHDTPDPTRPRASRGQRLVTHVIDVVIIMFGYIMITVLFDIVDGVFATEFTALMEDPSLSRVFGCSMMVMFYFLFEVRTGRTPGKILAGTRVVSEKGSRPTPGQILARSIIRLIPFESLSVFSRDRRMWHDKFSNTRVISERG